MQKNKYYKKLHEKAVKDTKSKIFSVIIIILLVGVGVYGYRCLSKKVCEIEAVDKFVRHDVVITTPRGEMTVEVADTESSRELGLSGRPSMKDDEGLLFAFDLPGQYGFWMKDMLFPLDIIWINQNGVVVEIERDARPESYPQTYMNKSPASYVLEVNAGIAEERGLYIGSKVKISK